MNILYVPFAFIMRLFDSFTGNYALTLLLFTLLFKIVLLPLGIKQQKNQIKMARLRPKEEVIRKKYAGRTDRATQQKMQQEIMELQQKENVSPFGGCMPLIVQLVLIMVIYTIIRQPLTYVCGFSNKEMADLFNNVEYKNYTAVLDKDGNKVKDENGDVKMEWVDFTEDTVKNADQFKAIATINAHGTDSLDDTYETALNKLPNLNLFGINLGYTPSEVLSAANSGNEVAKGFAPKTIDAVKYMILPVLCFILQVLSMKLTRKFTYQSPATQEAQAGCSMKLMDWMMPLMSLYFCFILSSAIGLYWIYSNIFSFAQTVILAKAIPVPKITEEDIKAAEKEMKDKGYDTRKPQDKIRVRSLHHIDDDDYDSLPEVENEVKGANQTLLNGEKVNTSPDKKPKIKD